MGPLEMKQTIDVPCGSLGPILEYVFAGEPIQYFSLNVEGSEGLIIDTIDFSSVQIDIFLIGMYNSYCSNDCEMRERIRRKMKHEGYLRYEGLIPSSDIFVHPLSPFQVPTQNG